MCVTVHTYVCEHVYNIYVSSRPLPLLFIQKYIALSLIMKNAY